MFWLDGVEKKYVEEVGSMNIFFIINGEVVMLVLNGSIFGGIIWVFVIELLKSWGIFVREEYVVIDDIY